MSSPGYFKFGYGINIWKEGINYNPLQSYDFIIGHSMGASAALKIWLVNKNAKLILIDPFISRKNIFTTFIDWLKFYQREENKYAEYYLSLKYLPKNILRLLRFPEENYWNILKDIPRDKLTVLHGERDLFLCGKEVCDKFKKLGFTVIDVPEAGHDWHENFDKAIIKMLN